MRLLSGDTPRDHILQIIRSDGSGEDVSFHVPAVIWVGTWDTTFDYAEGDAVAWNGASWVANCDHPQGPPGEAFGWNLMSKQGKPGVKGAPGIGIRGVELNGADLTISFTNGEDTTIEIAGLVKLLEEVQRLQDELIALKEAVS